jgi:sulfatase modifying factor 1
VRNPGKWVVLTGLLFATASHARRPIKAESFWRGLDPASERTPAQGIRALHPPLGGRIRIEGGSFVMGASATDVEHAEELCKQELWGLRCEERAFFRDEEPPHMVSLSSYAMDQTEVRVEDYERCVSAGVCSPPAFSPGDPRFDRPSLPITHVTWDDASTYCAWSGGRLPTEAEWEFAARGSASRDYPWGEIYNPHLCNHGAFAPDETDGSDGFVGLAPVGSFRDGATPDGLVDMAGNVAEWVADYYDRDEHTGFGYPNASQHNPTGPPSGVQHVVRGGSYLQGAAWLRTAWRGVPQGELLATADIGFRCAEGAAPSRAK